MKEELDKRLVKTFPLLYSDRHGDMQSTCMCWGFSCGDGWFQIIWDLSAKIEPIIRKYIKENPNLPCSVCGDEKNKHYGSQTKSPGKCLAIHVDPYSEEKPPGNYYACFCEKYVSSHPRAAQVKEKYGTLRFYMTSSNEEINNYIQEAEKLSLITCEICGKEGKSQGGWRDTLCKECNKGKTKWQK